MHGVMPVLKGNNMTWYLWVFAWLALGWLSTMVAAILWRRDGQTKSTTELYMALLAPLFGVFTFGLLLLTICNEKGKRK